MSEAMRAGACARPGATRRRVLAIAAWAAWAALAVPLAAAPGAAQERPLGDLVIETAAGPQRFKVELAATDETRQVGLMFRQSLGRDRGMLFDYRRPQPVAMWMKNTFIPLDMLFIAADGRVVNVAQRTVPHSLASVASAGPVRAVLEVNAGTIERLGVRPGDLVRHAIFGNLPASPLPKGR